MRGYDAVVCHNIKPDKSEYLGGKEMTIKGIADRSTGRLLGAQIVGESGVDKRIDVIATAITFGAKAEDLFHLDLAYAPAFLDDEGSRHVHRHDPRQCNRRRQAAYHLNGTRPSRRLGRIVRGHRCARCQTVCLWVTSPGAVNLPHESIRENLDALDKDATIVTYCNKGTTGNAAQNILLNEGFRKVYNLSGGVQALQGDAFNSDVSARYRCRQVDQ